MVAFYFEDIFIFPFFTLSWFSSLYPFLTWKHLVSHWWFPCLPALPNNWGHKHPYCNQSKMISNDCSYLSLCTCQQRLLFLLPIVCGYAISCVRIASLNTFFKITRLFLRCLHWALLLFWMWGTSKSITAGYMELIVDMHCTMVN